MQVLKEADAYISNTEVGNWRLLILSHFLRFYRRISTFEMHGSHHLVQTMLPMLTSLSLKDMSQ
jgi:hypothetical protein